MMRLGFRKSFKLAPGVRLNVGKSGTSWSLGPRGATLNIGKRGAFLNAGLPGTGISARIPLGGAAQPARPAATTATPPATIVSLTLRIDDEGTMHYLLPDGSQAPAGMIEDARRQHRDTIRDLLQRKCEEINAGIAALAELHWETPPPLRPERFVAVPFAEPPPVAPTAPVLGLADRLLPGRKQAVEAEHAEQVRRYQAAMAAYESARAAHDEANVQARMDFSAAIAGNPDAMQRLLERRLGEIVWPKETQVDFDIDADGTRLMLDVDLPEIEQMPSTRATLGSRSWDLSMKDAGEQATRKLYQQHVHALGFRIIGEAFAALPTIRLVVFSGYSQRRDRSTGHLAEDYLYSVRVARDQWNTLNFDALDQVDATAALASFELRRDMTTTGIFRPIEPWASGDA